MNCNSARQGTEQRPSKEERFLLELARDGVIERTGKREPVRGGIDWGEFEQVARDHKMVPFVHQVVSTADGSIVPDSTVAELERQSRRYARRNLLLVETLHEVCELLDDHGLRVLPFKGPTLSAAVHGDVALRQSVDLDLLVSPAEVDDAMAVLRANGFRTVVEGSPAVQRAARRTGNHYAIQSNVGVRVELHWNLTPPHCPYPYDFDRLWNNRETVVLDGRVVPTLSTPERVLFLVVHGGKHRWKALAWLCDVAILFTADDIDWQEVSRMARERGCERLLNLAGVLCRDLLTVKLPRRITESVEADSAAEKLGVRVRERFLWRRTETELARLIYRLRSRERLTDRARVAVEVLLRPHTNDFEYLPRSIQYRPLAALVRQARIARLGIGMLFDRAD